MEAAAGRAADVRAGVCRKSRRRSRTEKMLSVIHALMQHPGDQHGVALLDIENQRLFSR
jgi:hypothetical protein